MINKARYWTGVLYPENMIDDWQEEIGDLLQLPYVYCIHDKDLDNDGDSRKVHVHLMIVFPNTTTQKHAMSVFDVLSASGKSALNTIQAVINVRSMYNYLIHDTDTCKRKNKHLYDKKDRIVGNNFDIGTYEQVSAQEKINMAKELSDIIMREHFIDFGEFYLYVTSNFDDVYFEILKTNSGFFERLIKSNYHAFNREREKAKFEEIKNLLSKDRQQEK